MDDASVARMPPGGSGRPPTDDVGDVPVDDAHPHPHPHPNPCGSSAFAFSPAQLHALLSHRNLAALEALGGLRTDTAAGLSADEGCLGARVGFEEAVAAVAKPPASPAAPFADRKRLLGTNQLPVRRHKSFVRLMWIAFNDKLLILLTFSASISLAIGINHSRSLEITSSSVEWVDGVTVIVAIVVIVLASAFNDWQQNHMFEKVNRRKKQRDVTVVRSGQAQRLSIHDVLVGDVMHVEAGEVLAVDGILVQASGLHVDESSVSGEAAPVHKTVPGDHNASHARLADPFILSGTTVTCGVGRYLVTAVGANSTYGRTLMSLREDVEETPLQAKLGRLGKQLILVGAIAGTIFIVLFIRYLVNLSHITGGPSKRAERFVQLLIISIALVVIAVPEGLALNVTVALAFATKRMLRDNNLVRLLRSCEIMGNVTCVCSDKTGTLTQNKMTVVAGRIGLDCSFDDSETVLPAARRRPTSARLAASLSANVHELVRHSMVLNSTAIESDAAGGYLGSSTETALLQFARDRLGMAPLSLERAKHPIVAMLPFESSRKWMAVLLRLSSDRYRLLVKGAAEVVLEYCAYVISDPTDDLAADRMSEQGRTSSRLAIQAYADNMFRPVAIAYQDFDASEVFESQEDDPVAVNLEWLASGLVFVGVFGICDPLRLEVVESVRKCQEAGVFVRMVTGDNFLTAKAIATACGIYTAAGVAMDGPTFRRLTPAQLDAIIPRLQVLARSSPEDKLLLVSQLRTMKETVAVTGDGTNDALALKAADVGLAMGLQGTEVAKEAASIILFDDNFASIVKALSWGRTVNDAVQKFCQFQFTINITASILTVSVLVGEPIFTVVQLLWINLIMDIFASLGLATELPSPEFLKRKPEPRNAPIISITMWKMILGQAAYQLATVFTIHYAGGAIFRPSTEREMDRLQTMAFNTYVWMQFFNQHNCRRVDNKLDIWHQSVLRNPWFIGVQCLTMIEQFLIVFKGGEAFDTVPLTGAQWGWSLLLGLLMIPLGALLRQVPDRLVLACFRLFKPALVVAVRVLRSATERLPCRPGRRKGRLRDREAAEAARSTDATPASHEFADSSGTSGSPDRSSQSWTATQATEDTADGIDLYSLIEHAKVGRPLGRDKLELHPDTLKDDPIVGARSDVSLPPSQDPALDMFLRRPRDDDHGRRRRRGRAEPPSSGPAARKGWDWDGVLRSKRR